MSTSYIQAEFLRKAMNARANGEKTTPHIKAYAREAGISMQAAYKMFGEHGLVDKRKQRSDKGNRKVSAEDASKVHGFVLKAERKTKHKRGLPVGLAVEELQKDGVIPRASVSTYRRALKDQNADVKLRKEDRPFITLRSERPGDVFQVDASQAAQWYLRGTKLAYDKSIDSYKPEKYKDGQLKRYIVTDHYTSAFWVMYQNAKGERAIDFLKVLHEAMTYKGSNFPMCSIPRLVYSDGGAGLTAEMSQRVFGTLGCKFDHHEKGAPRAKGLVENRHGQWEQRFENLLLARGIMNFTLNELNGMAYEYCLEWNRSIINRRLDYGKGATPFAAWHKYFNENPTELDMLRYPPSWERIEDIALSSSYSRVVRGNWTISFNSKMYSLSRLSEYGECQPKSKVVFKKCFDLGRESSIEIITSDGLRHVVDPVVVGMDGRPVDAPVLGKEFKSVPDSLAYKARKKALVAEVEVEGENVLHITQKQEPKPRHNRMLSRPEWIDRYAKEHDVDLATAASAYRSCYGSDDVAEGQECDIGVVWHEDNIDKMEG